MYLIDKYTYQKMLKLIDLKVGEYTKNAATPVSLKLPQLSKVGGKSVEEPKLKLPSLKKVT